MAAMNGAGGKLETVFEIAADARRKRFLKGSGIIALLVALIGGGAKVLGNDAKSEAAATAARVDEHARELAEIREKLERIDGTLGDVQVNLGILLERTGSVGVHPIPAAKPRGK